MKKIAFLSLLAAILPINSGFAQIDAELLVKGMGYVEEMKSTASNLKQSNEDCVFSETEIGTVYYLALEYNSELKLKGGGTGEVMSGLRIQQEITKNVENREIKKSSEKKGAPEKIEFKPGEIDLKPFSTFAEDSGEVARVAQQLSYLWSSSLSDDEKKLITKAQKSTCTFKKVKVWGGVLEKVLKSSGISGMEMITDTLNTSGSFKDAGTNLLGNQQILEKLVK